MIGKLIRILRHPRVIRDALTNAAWMVDGDIAYGFGAGVSYHF